VPGMLRRIYRALDWDWAFGLGGDISASVGYRFVCRADCISGREKRPLPGSQILSV